ncbi:hypothetical protein [Myxococcus sp. RHSTA-1-4]|uniref:hypothetical protein n=1 Tax=Myxococcus sp. RHSTA-1-4 TaxID=2874601 RepID=UPI001CBE6B9A|nr:hypothetical protein [Myxococcus sp. RHSTA-1-4]MBZ4416407.1 hypothetical protein [Myxococcus sp. RHSTA-1-4]
MHWRTVSGCVLLLGAVTGCPHTLSKEGFTNRAIRADMRDRVVQECPKWVFDDFCVGGRHETQKCIERCAAAIKAHEEEDE